MMPHSNMTDVIEAVPQSATGMRATQSGEGALNAPPASVAESGARGEGQREVIDFISGAKRWRFWMMLGWNDVKQRYHRTILGPFWITMSIATLVIALGIIYGPIFGTPLANYLPYLAAGIVSWYLVSSCLIESMTAFISAEGIIKQSAIPFSIYLYRTVWRNLIVFAHNQIVVVLVVLAFRSVSFGSLGLLALGLTIVSLNLFAASVFLAIMATRFRDLPPIVTNLMQVLFFVTPVLYSPSQLPPKLLFIAQFNPLYHIIEVLRRPMVGEWPSLMSYGVSVGCFFGLSILSYMMFKRFRSRIAYWL